MFHKSIPYSFTRFRRRYSTQKNYLKGKNFEKVLIVTCSSLGLGFILSSFETTRNACENIVRMSRSLITCALISADYKFSLIGLAKDEIDKQYPIIHQRSANRLLNLFKKQGGLYVKTGQHLTSLHYLLPLEYCNTMKELTNRASFIPFKYLYPVFLQEVGLPPEKYFDKFEQEPIAAASISQVHRAYKDGKCYAVKIQLPDVERHSYYDIKTLEIVTNVVHWLFPNLKLHWLTRELKENLPAELNFELEASNAKRIQSLFKDNPNFASPEILFSSKKVLIMEYIDGKSIDDVKGIQELGFRPKTVAYHLNKIFNDQIFVHKFVHCDPHSGNLLVRPSPVDPKQPQICLIDNGLYREYDEDFCMKYAKLWLAILTVDEKKIGEASKHLGVEDHKLFASIMTARPWSGITSNPFEETLSTEVAQIKRQASSRTFDITNVLELVPSHLLLLLKTNDLLRMANKRLGSSYTTSLSETLKYSIEFVHERASKTEKGIYYNIKRYNEKLVIRLKLFFIEWISPIVQAILKLNTYIWDNQS